MALNYQLFCDCCFFLFQDDSNNGLRQGSKTTQSYGRHMKHKQRPPRGMYLNKEDLVAIATGPPGQGEAILKQLEAENVALKRTVSDGDGWQVEGGGGGGAV